MTERPGWTVALQWIVWAVVMSLVMAWLGRSRLRARSTADARTLVYPPSTLIVGLVGFVFFAGIAIVSNAVPNPTTAWWTTAIFAGFALLSLFLVVAACTTRHVVTEAGLSYRKLLGTTRDLRWADVREARYAPAMKWFRVQTRSGDVARISVMLMGLPKFARLVLAHVPADAIPPETRPILQATADGNPPSVWT